MPQKSSFQHYNLSFNKQKVFAVSNFLGADFNPAQLQIADNHATDILNVIYKDKVNQKRKGWEQLAQVEPYEYYAEENGNFVRKTNSTNINAVWQFVGKDNRKYVVAHIGNILFKVEGLGNQYNFLNVELKPLERKVLQGELLFNVCNELEDYKSQAFVGDGCLYILGGNKLYVLSADNNTMYLEQVEDGVNTYIPTTTIGITYADSPINGRQALDDVNMMTQFRKNKLVSGTYIDNGVDIRSTRFWDFALDTSIKSKKPTDINKIKITINSLKEVE